MAKESDAVDPNKEMGVCDVASATLSTWHNIRYCLPSTRLGPRLGGSSEKWASPWAGIRQALLCYANRASWSLPEAVSSVRVLRTHS